MMMKKSVPVGKTTGDVLMLQHARVAHLVCAGVATCAASRTVIAAPVLTTFRMWNPNSPNFSLAP